MNKSKFSEKQIHFILNQAEKGARVCDICKFIGISQATFYSWRHRYGTVRQGANQEINYLKEEIERLKETIDELENDKRILLEELIKRR